PENSAGFEVCPGPVNTLRVWVMAKPTVQFVEANTQAVNSLSAAQVIGNSNSDNVIGGCGIAAGAATNVYLPVRVTGSDQFQVSYTVDFYNVSNLTVIASSTSTTSAKFDAGASFLNISGGTDYETANVNDGVHAQNDILVTVPANTYGKWVVTLTGVTDRISRKSLSDPNGDGTPNQDMGTVITTAGVDKLTLWSLPTPTTAPVQHKVNNFAW
ncbi:MAG TPA: hypothetical protein VIO15_03725, partial [Bacteroidales bacterium]